MSNRTSSFPSTSFSTPSTSSPYVTDRPPPPPPSSSSVVPNLPTPSSSPSTEGRRGEGGGGERGERNQTLEEMYSVPENYLEIECREPRTQGSSCFLSFVSFNLSFLDHVGGGLRRGEREREMNEGGRFLKSDLVEREGAWWSGNWDDEGLI